MNEIAGLPAPARILLPDVGALALTARHAVWLTPDGEIEELTPQQLAGRGRIRPAGPVLPLQQQ